MSIAKVLTLTDRQHVIDFGRGVACCWSNIGGAGSFDTDKADELIEDFCDYLVGVARTDGPIKTRPPHYYEGTVKPDG